VDESEPEVSVVIPCLNEADTWGVCLDKARQSLSEAAIQYDLIVARFVFEGNGYGLRPYLRGWRQGARDPLHPPPRTQEASRTFSQVLRPQ